MHFVQKDRELCDCLEKKPTKQSRDGGEKEIAMSDFSTLCNTTLKGVHTKDVNAVREVLHMGGSWGYCTWSGGERLQGSHPVPVHSDPGHSQHPVLP